MKRGVDMRQAKTALEATYSVPEVMAHFGLKERKVRDLLALGRKFKGCHPLKGGLWPLFKPSPKCVRITATAIEAHKRHMARLEEDDIFAAEQKARARALGEQAAA